MKLSKPQETVLHVLNDSPALRVGGHRPFTLQTCEALERRGLVEIRPEEGFGRPLVDITPAGMQFLDALASRAEEPTDA